MKSITKKLKVWIDREATILDKNIEQNASGIGTFYVKALDSNKVKIGIEREISLLEYQQGYIGKYANEAKEWLKRLLQKYALTNNLTLVLNPLDFKSNEEELYREFERFCEESNLETLLKPSGISSYVVYDEFNSKNIEGSLQSYPNLGEHLISAIDWYNVGLLQSKASNQFLHYFIPLEILTAKFITNSTATWKKENTKEYKLIEAFLIKTLKPEDANKFNGVISFLSELSFLEKIKRYFQSLFTKEEIAGFWLDDSDITFNGKHPWKQYRLISQRGVNKEKADLLNVLKDFYQKRNDIVHKGIENITSEDIFVIENILRRVLKKEMESLKS